MQPSPAGGGEMRGEQWTKQDVFLSKVSSREATGSPAQPVNSEEPKVRHPDSFVPTLLILTQCCFFSSFLASLDTVARYRAENWRQ